jgi:hypothetical protein
MSKMSDIHAAASEIDTTDAEAIQALADSLAAERYAAAIAAYADAVRGVIESLASDAGEPMECDECGIDDGARWDMPDGRAVCDGCKP